MNTDMKLELKHLAPYLPYGVKCYVDFKDEESGDVVYIPTVDLTTDNIQYYLNSRVTGMIALRPLSDLVDQTLIATLCKKAIFQIWGFDDFDFIIKSYHNEGDNYGIVATSDDWLIGFTVDFEMQKDFRLSLATPGQESTSYMMLDKLELFNWMLENHFDVFGLIDAGLAIDINSIKA